MSILIDMGSVRKIKFFDEFWCVGFDESKVSQGISDNTRLRDIDQTQSWNKEIVASKKNYYKDLNTTKSEMVELNEQMMNFEVLE